MFLLVKNAQVWSPEPLGLCDILCAAGVVAAVLPSRPGIDPSSLPFDVETLDVDGACVIPGLVDGHVHLVGGGGEGGFATRTPELVLGQTFRAGVTSVVGVLGTDGIARSMESLVAKAMALREEGLSAWCFTGSYRIPLRTITGEADRDIMMVDPVIGVGEVAISDHRSSWPSFEELSRVASQARVGGMLAGKSGIVDVHLGESPDCLSPLEEVVARTRIPRTQFLPTHCNRSRAVEERCLAWALSGGYVDFTASEVAGEDADLSAMRSYARFLKAGVAAGRMSVTSDGQGSLPVFREDGTVLRLAVGTCDSMTGALIQAVEELGMPLDLALAPLTSSPAAILDLKGKGRIGAGMDADLVILDSGYTPDTVIARGRVVVRGHRLLVPGIFGVADPES